MNVVLALADVGLAMPLEEQLVAAGFTARWDATLADGPRGELAVEVVVLDADHLGDRLSATCDAWRSLPSVPGVIAIGGSPAARDAAPRARVTLLASTAKMTTLTSALRDAARLRLTTRMSWSAMRGAVGLPPAGDTRAAWQPTLTAARTIELDIPRAALRWHAYHYATPTPRLDELRDERVLTVPELAAAATIDGTRTVASHVKDGPLESLQAARLLWALASLGALELTPEVRDLTTPARRQLAELRGHIRARSARLERSTYYDVLEVTVDAEYPQLEAAYQALVARYSPPALAVYDLGELAHEIKPLWEIVEKARSVLVDHAARGRYHDWLRARSGQLRTVWAIEPRRVTAASEHFARGQRALGEGDAHRAMGDLAAACRHFPGHPEYEANLAWARYRVQVASGKDRVAAANLERAMVEDLLRGCRPWPRALVALALLCTAANDVESARWHLHSALVIDPRLPAAIQLAHRLGVRR